MKLVDQPVQQTVCWLQTQLRRIKRSLVTGLNAYKPGCRLISYRFGNKDLFRGSPMHECELPLLTDFRIGDNWSCFTCDKLWSRLAARWEYTGRTSSEVFREVILARV